MATRIPQAEERRGRRRVLSVLRAAGGAVTALDRAAMGGAAAALFIMMLVMVSDVVGRYLFNAPLAWAFDLVSLYLMVAVFFLAVSDTMRRNRHVGVTLFRDMMWRGVRRWADLLTTLVALVLFAMIFVLSLDAAAAAWRDGDRLVGVVAWPTWIYQALVPIGIGALLLRLGAQLLRQGLVLAGADDLAEAVRPPPDDHRDGGGHG